MFSSTYQISLRIVLLVSHQEHLKKLPVKIAAEVILTLAALLSLFSAGSLLIPMFTYLWSWYFQIILEVKIMWFGDYSPWDICRALPKPYWLNDCASPQWQFDTQLFHTVSSQFWKYRLLISHKITYLSGVKIQFDTFHGKCSPALVCHWICTVCSYMWGW